MARGTSDPPAATSTEDCFRAGVEQLYRQHHARLLAFAERITHRSDVAEDALHEAVLRLWATKRCPCGSPTAYFLATIRNAAIDQRNTLADKMDRRIWARSNESPMWTAIAVESKEQIRNAVTDLPLHYREVVFLHLFGGFTFRQIAVALGTPLGTITSRYRRALERLAASVPR